MISISTLSEHVAGPVLQPGMPGYDRETAAFLQLVPQRPDAVVGATSAADIRAAVSFAAERGLPVGVLATGHGAYVPSDGALLINTRRLTEVVIAPATRTARAGAGVRWQQVIEAAAAHGLAPLSGSSPDVGVVGYTLGGGLSPIQGRARGFAADHVTAIEIVTADGRLRRVTATAEPGLFWALRGAGRGAFGVVTAIEFGLFPGIRLYGGGLVYAGEHVDEVLRAWAKWAADAPEDLSTSVALIRSPERFVVHVRVAYLGDPGGGELLLAPMRMAAPLLLDTVAEMPFTDAGTIHDEPAGPILAVDGGMLLDDLAPGFVDRLVEMAGPDVAGADTVTIAELRRLGGALARPPQVADAVGGRDAGYSFLAVKLLPSAELAGPARKTLHTLLDALRPWDNGTLLASMLNDEDAAEGRTARTSVPGRGCNTSSRSTTRATCSGSASPFPRCKALPASATSEGCGDGGLTR